MAGNGIGATLASLGEGQKQEAVSMLGKAADEETQRNANNTMIEAQAKAGKQQLGGTLGAVAGFAIGGPIGGLIGGTLGAVAGGLF